MITTKIENKNKNNFKMMMENFQNWNDSQDKIKTILENESDEKIWELATCHENEISSLLMEKILNTNISLFLKNAHLLEEDAFNKIVLTEVSVDKLLGMIVGQTAKNHGTNAVTVAKEMQTAKRMLAKKMSKITDPALLKRVKDAISAADKFMKAAPGLEKAARAAEATARAARTASSASGGGSGAAGQGAKAAGQKAGAEIAKKGSAELAKQGVKQGAKQAAAKGGQLAVSQGVKQAAAKGGQLALTQAAPQVAARTGLSQAVAKKGLQQLALQGGKQIAARGVLALLGPIGWGITAISIGYSLYQMTQDGEDPKKVVPKIPEPTEAEKQALARQFSANMSVMQRDVLNRNAMLRAANSLNMMEEDIAMAIMYNPKKAQGMIAKLKADEKSMGADGFKEFLEIVEFLNPASMPGAGGSPSPSPSPTPSGRGGGMKALARRQAELIRRINQGVTGLNEEDQGPPVPGTEEQSVDLEMLQQSLMRLGMKLPRFGADGDYGRETYRAIRAFQKKSGLEVDGLIGPDTFAEMREKDPKIMSQSATMGMNVDQGAEETLDKIAKAPKRAKEKAYIKALNADDPKSREDVMKLRDRARQVFADANDEMRKDTDPENRNRLAKRQAKARAVVSSIDKAELERKKGISKKKRRQRAIKSGFIHMDSSEKPKNQKMWSDIARFGKDMSPANSELRQWFLKTYTTRKDSSAILRLMHILRTGQANNIPDSPLGGKLEDMAVLQRMMRDAIEKKKKEILKAYEQA